ncbi:MAG: hypothetical protein MJ219_00425 [Mycoplasmoidaceae bacterium]|nr:hypothetical protein [Mycoplasmoidaceae bacterium]
MLNINNDNLSNFFNEIKNEILLRSNNISLFILILFLSVNFKQNNIDCIELISNPDLCSHDNERILLKKILPIGVTDRLFYDDRKETLLIYTLNL